ncbi:MAG: hypothetical protein QNK18_05135 [Gammaproteobacteria bacterium]|nr:hypothetical protein [Gammaproteobacteria bacterium]
MNKKYSRARVEFPMAIGLTAVMAFLPSVQSAEPSTTDEAPRAAGAPDLATDLREQLEGMGWRVELDAEGNTLLLPPVDTPAASAEIRPPASSQSTPDLAAALRTQLQARGWRVEEDAEGNTFLLPPRAVTDPPPDKGAGAASEDLASKLRRELQTHGWRVVEDAEGHTLLLPPPAAQQVPQPGVGHSQAPRGGGGLPGRSSVPAAATERHACPGVVLPPVTRGQVVLPVDSWQEARMLGEAWLAAANADKLAVGEIYRVLDLFVISLIDPRLPHEPTNQLIVRSSDGGVISVH